MVDAVTAAIGCIIMIGYIWLIADKLNELPLWIACIVGIALMLWAFWRTPGGRYSSANSNNNNSR